MNIAIISGALSVKALETIQTVHPDLTLVPLDSTMVVREWHLNGDVAIVGSTESFGYSPFDQSAHCASLQVAAP